MLVVRWIDACPHRNNRCTQASSRNLCYVYTCNIVSICVNLHALQGNNYQVVLLTDGTRSYTVFTYKCGELNYSKFPTAAAIGFSAGLSLYANHPLSHRYVIVRIYCLSQLSCITMEQCHLSSQ